MLSENSIRLNIEINSSRLLFLLIVVFHFMLLWSGILIVTQFWQLMIFTGFALISFGYYTNLYLLRRTNKAVMGLILDDKERWHLVNSSSQLKSYQLAPQFYVTQNLIILYFKLSYFRLIAVPIFSDSVSKEDFYQLKMYLLNKRN